MLIQACYELSAPGMHEREVRGIPETMRHLGLDRALVVTANERASIERDGVTIEVAPAWKWLVEAS
jgi:predicted AAA+ superfamily ATPase